MRYLFYITSWNDFQTEISDALDENWEKFGEALGQDGKIIKPYDSASYRVYEEIQSKSWDEKTLDRMRQEQDPFMLVVTVDFESFDPNENQWAIIWFSEFQDSPEDIPYTLKNMAKIARESDDLISYLKEESSKKEMADYAEIVELKPGIFGCSIDLKKAAKKLLGFA